MLVFNCERGLGNGLTQQDFAAVEFGVCPKQPGLHRESPRILGSWTVKPKNAIRPGQTWFSPMRFYGIAILIELVPTDSTATMFLKTSCDEAWAGLCMQEYGWLRALGRGEWLVWSLWRQAGRAGLFDLPPGFACHPESGDDKNQQTGTMAYVGKVNHWIGWPFILENNR